MAAVVRDAAGSESHAAQAAREALERGNAVDAVLTGVLVAAAEAPSVFLGPLQILVAGAGAGLLAIDGRLRQPGRGAPRPRGFLADEVIPDASRVAVPMLPATAAAALAALGSATLARTCAPAVAWAKGRSPERAALFETFARRGAPTLSEDAIAAELLAVAGRAARGLLTRDDLAEAAPVIVRHDVRSLEPAGFLVAPWAAGATHDAASTHVIAAVDARGLAAVACYEASPSGVAVPNLGVVAPPGAEPVLRGTTRVAPGRTRPAAAPIALRVRPAGVELALGVAADERGERSLRAVMESLDSAATVAEALAIGVAGGGGRAIAIARSRDAVRVIASA